MDRSLKEIFIELESLSEKSGRQQRKLKNELEEKASLLGADFEKAVREITPSEDSILFEIYESISINPERWITFIVSEIRRIKIIAEESEKENQCSIIEPLLAISFFARQEF